MKTIFLKGDIGWEITADKILAQLDMKSTEKIRVFINSPGGFVFEAFEIYNIFKSYKGKIEMVIMPYAASAASYIVMAGDKISAFKNSVFMAHRITSVAIGDADEMLREAEIMQSLEGIIIDAYRTRIKIEKEDMKKMLKDELWLIGWEQLADSGIIDNVIDNTDEIELTEEEKSEIDKSIKESENMSISLIKLKISKTESRMRKESDNIKNMYERIAAKLEINPAEKKPVENKIKEDNAMTLEEFLKSNPDAKAEYESVLKSAEDQVRIEMTQKFAGEREKLAKILEYENVSLSQAAADALKGEIDLETYKDAKIKEQNEKREKPKNSPFDNLVPKQTPKEQAPAIASEHGDGVRPEYQEKLDKFSEETKRRYQ